VPEYEHGSQVLSQFEYKQSLNLQNPQKRRHPIHKALEFFILLEAASRLHFLKQLKRSGAGRDDLLCFTAP